jgi:hypothetical protein
MLTAEKILKAVLPGDLFGSSDEKELNLEWRSLARKWHPDLHTDKTLALQVMTHINNLHDDGVKLIKDGKWSRSNFIQLKTLDNRLFKVTFLVERTFELGKLYICNSSLFYLVDKQHKPFYDNYIRRIENLKYASSDMKTEFTKYLPTIQSRFETAEFYGVIITKPTDVLSLRDVLSHFNGILPDRHMAWTLSSLYNTACFLDYNKLAHNGINVDNYFISPEFHSGMLLGGWWYTVGYGEKLTGAPKDVYDIMTLKTKSEKIGSYITDLDSIRQLGRELCGDRLGNKLLSSSAIPKALINWLQGGATKKPVEEYSAWGKVLDSGYGKRTFVELKIDARDLYKKD